MAIVKRKNIKDRPKTAVQMLIQFLARTREVDPSIGDNRPIKRVRETVHCFNRAITDNLALRKWQAGLAVIALVTGSGLREAGITGNNR